jgi:hypothetical protein
MNMHLSSPSSSFNSRQKKSILMMCIGRAELLLPKCHDDHEVALDELAAAFVGSV